MFVPKYKENMYISAVTLHEVDISVPLPWFQARYRREHAQKNIPSLPLVENLLKDNTDGCALAALLHFYCPQAVRLEGGCPDPHALNEAKDVRTEKSGWYCDYYPIELTGL